MNIISGVQQAAIKCVIYGPEGIGKSSFAAQAPNPLFCDLEESTTFLNVRRFEKAKSIPALEEQIDYVLQNPACCDTLVVDTGDWLEKLCCTHVCQGAGKAGIEDFGYGKGYTYVYEQFGKILNKLSLLIQKNVNVIMTAHAAMRKFEQPDESGSYDRWELKLINSQKCSVANMVKEWADMVLFANYETYVVKGKDGEKNKAAGGRRVMFTTHHPCWDAKNRFGLPDKLPLEFGQVAHLFMAKSMTVAPQTAPQQKPIQLPTVQQEPMIQDTDSNFRILGPEEDDGVYPFDVVVPEGTLPALAQLMRENAVTNEEISAVVAQRGYFPAGMSVNQYPVDFVSGVLVGAWKQVFEMVKNNRKK